MKGYEIVKKAWDESYVLAAVVFAAIIISWFGAFLAMK